MIKCKNSLITSKYPDKCKYLDLDKFYNCIGQDIEGILSR